MLMDLIKKVVLLILIMSPEISVISNELMCHVLLR